MSGVKIEKADLAGANFAGAIVDPEVLAAPELQGAHLPKPDKSAAERLDEILAAHLLWADGEGGPRADLSNADLSGHDLRGRNLAAALMARAVLKAADLSHSILSMAD